MATLEETPCCGVDIIDGLESNPRDTVLEVCYHKYDEEGWGGQDAQAFIIFTDTVKDKRGAALAEFITKHGFGTVVRPARARKNPNSGNMILAWIWSPNETKLKKFWKKNKGDLDYD